MAESSPNSVVRGESASRAEKLLDGLGWAALLITTGIFWLIPDRHVPSGSWLIAVGVIITAVTIARLIYGYRASEFALSAGVIALTAGIGSVLGLSLPLFPIALIAIGCCVILVRHIERRSKLPAAEDPLCCR